MKNTFYHRQSGFYGNKNVELEVIQAVRIIYRICDETAFIRSNKYSCGSFLVNTAHGLTLRRQVCNNGTNEKITLQGIPLRYTHIWNITFMTACHADTLA